MPKFETADDFHIGMHFYRPIRRWYENNVPIQVIMPSFDWLRTFTKQGNNFHVGLSTYHR